LFEFHVLVVNVASGSHYSSQWSRAQVKRLQTIGRSGAFLRALFFFILITFFVASH
jgi:hypothetical protein